MYCGEKIAPCNTSRREFKLLIVAPTIQQCASSLHPLDNSLAYLFLNQKQITAIPKMQSIPL